MILDSTATLRRALALLGVTLLLGVVAVTLATPKAAGYEISIYKSFPWYYWALVIGTIVVGCLTILTSAFAEQEADQHWAVGVATVLVADLVLLLMPYIRGYPMYGRADPMTHLGYIKVITDTGVAGGGNIYPNTHLLVQTLAYATGQEPMAVINVVPAVVTFLYFGGMVLLMRHTFESRTHALMGLPLALLPVYSLTHHGTSPYRLTTLIIPFVLYLFVKEQQSGSIPVRAALVVTLIAIIVYHPLATVFLLLIFFVQYLVKHTPQFRAEQANPTNIASLVTVVFTAWYLNFSGMIFRFEGIVEAFVFDDSQAPIDSYSNTISSTSPDLVDLVRVAAFKYGIAAVLVGIGFSFLAIQLYRWLQNEFEPNVFTTVFGISLIGFTAGSAAFLFFDLIVGIDRPLQFAKISGIVLASALIYYLGSEKLIPDPQFTLTVIVVLLLAVSLTTFSLYESPLSSEVNPQVTEMELDGSEWMFENRNGEREIEEFGIRQYRFHDALYGVPARDEVRRTDTIAPPHFNYTIRPYYGANYEEDRYLLLTRLGRVTYPSKFPDYRAFWQFTPADFDRLERDRTVNRLYDNGDFTAYSVNAVALGSNATTSPGAAATETALTSYPDGNTTTTTTTIGETGTMSPGPLNSTVSGTAMAVPR